jgi:hypothetical protein
LNELYPESVRAHVFNYATVPHGDQMDAHKSFKHGAKKGKSARGKIVAKKRQQGIVNACVDGPLAGKHPIRDRFNSEPTRAGDQIIEFVRRLR